VTHDSTPRPVGAALAAALLGVAALAGAIFGPYLVVLGALLRRDVGGDEGLLVLTIEVALGLGCLVLAAVAILAARALWRGASWGWPAAVFVGVVLVVATLTVAMVGTWLPAYALIAVLGVTIIASLASPSARRPYGL
jgi:hypothetical protein